MQKSVLGFLLMEPVFAFGQTEIGPDRYFPHLVVGVLIGIPMLNWLFGYFSKEWDKSDVSSFSRHRQQTQLVLGGSYRPELLTSQIHNNTARHLVIEPPVLHICRLWTISKFKLKGICRAEIYPRCLKKGKNHELQINLSVFSQYAPTLRSYYRGRVSLVDTAAGCYLVNYITPRKSYFL